MTSPGAVFPIRVALSGTIGRVGTWKGRAPKIAKIAKVTRDCIRPGAKKPSRCPRR